MTAPKVTVQAKIIMRYFLANAKVQHYGLRIAQHTGLNHATVYPILIRLERAGWLTSRWERIDPRREQRARRRYYRLTRSGAAAARAALDRSSRAAHTRPTRRQARPSLGHREHQVLIGMSHGMTEPAMAARLHLSVNTVKTHAKHLKQKLGAADRAHAVRLGFELRLLAADDPPPEDYPAAR